MILKSRSIHLLNALASMGYLIEIIDKKGYYVFCSDNCNYDSYTPKEMVNKHITEAYDLTEENSALLDILRTGKPKKDIFLRYISRKTGKEFLWLYNAFPIIEKGSIEGAITIYRPIEEYKDILSKLNDSTARCKDKLGCINCKESDLYVFDDIIYSSQCMQNAINISKRVSKNNSPVLLVGKTGTGKELFAQSIHTNSHKSNSPFVAVNCAAIPDTLLEGILFGVSKGAYTSAIEKKGLFEKGNGGTIFLDEIQSLSIEMQSKLLRVLETSKIRRVGADEETPINARIISAMNVDPMEQIQNGNLKLDLFYRIAVITINIPPLKERGNDIELLTNVFIRQINNELNTNIESCSEEVLQIFSKYCWPGNVRELHHTIEHAANVMNDNEKIIRKTHLPFYLELSDFQDTCCDEKTNSEVIKEEIPSYPIGDYKITRQQALNEFTNNFNHAFLSNALKAYGGNISKTARAINISRQHLHELISKYEL